MWICQVFPGNPGDSMRLQKVDLKQNKTKQPKQTKNRQFACLEPSQQISRFLAASAPAHWGVCFGKAAWPALSLSGFLFILGTGP